MLDLVKEFSNKLNIKKHLFLLDNSFEIYRNMYKSKSNIPTDNLAGKLVEIIDENMLNEERFLLIASEGNELGWITIERPLFIYHTFSERVVVNDSNTTNSVNEMLSLYDTVDENTIYMKKYFLEHDGLLYFGLVKDDKLISFLKAEQVTNGDIEPLGFRFQGEQVLIYQDIFLVSEFMFLNNEDTYYCDKVLKLKNHSIGSFKNGRTRYWFKIDNTDIDLDVLTKTDNRNKEYYLMEHLFYTQQKEKNHKALHTKNNTIEEEIIKQRFADYNERINDLIKENRQLKAELNSSI